VLLQLGEQIVGHLGGGAAHPVGVVEHQLVEIAEQVDGPVVGQRQ
jgi:hypothetical protein